MKTPHYSIPLLSLGLLLSPFAQAQDQPKEGANPPRGEGRRGGGEGGQGRGQMMTAEGRVQQLDEALKLTADQKTKITAIYTKMQDEMRSMMRDGGADQANREKMMESMRATREQVRALLTDEQKAKFDAMPQRGGRGEGRGRDGGSEKREKKN